MAIYELAQNIKKVLLDLAKIDLVSPIRAVEDVEMLDGKLYLKKDLPFVCCSVRARAGIFTPINCVWDNERAVINIRGVRGKK